jgi:ubiquinone/menaquinone biosynthesis C-methylase UbiE
LIVAVRLLPTKEISVAHDVCPWWLGYFLASPIRKLRHDPARILGPYIREGMVVLEPGPGMGFFTLEIARRIGAAGRVIAVDIQQKMLDSLRRRAQRRGVSDRIELRLARPDTMGISDLDKKIEFVLAFAVVHEMPNAEKFFAESFAALKPGGRLLFSEPSDHITAKEFERSLALAKRVGFYLNGSPAISGSISAELVKEKLTQAKAKRRNG